VLDNVQMHPLLTPKISMPIASHNVHLHTFTIAAPHTWLHGSIYKEGIPDALSFVRIYFFAGDVYRGGGEFLDAFSFTM